MAESRTPWYADGLRFRCSGCGACCRVEGHVWVGEDDIRRLAEHLDLSLDDFGSRYLRRVGRRYSLVEKPNHDCVFWDDGCTVYEARPPQCRSFPFWSECLESPEAWAEASEDCRGIDRGRVYDVAEIRAITTGETATASGPAAGCGCDEK